MIGYYIHHHGRGHLQRATQIATRARTPVTGLSSLPRPTAWPGPWLHLPADTGGTLIDSTARGRLHWAPAGHPGLRHRMGLTAEWLDRTAPAVFVADVSAELGCFARLMGIPLVVMAMRGDRHDDAHRLVYDLADTLIAPWPAAFPEPGWPQAWLDKTVHTGAISRYDKRPPHTEDPAPDEHPRAVVLFGAGGADIAAGELEQAAAATPYWTWHTLGLNRWTDDPWPHLCHADVLVTHAGQNAVAECAAAARPTIVIPQDRPFGEQHATARALADAHLAVVRLHWPAPDHWPGLLAAACEVGGDRWGAWRQGGGAMRAAAVLDGFTQRPSLREAA